MAIRELSDQFSQRINLALQRCSDLLLAIAVIVVLAMMIVPLPTWAIDILIAVNITTAALILITALYLPDAAKFSSFPTILLLTTLFRLAINVSSTRLVLLQADAGEIIAAFGEFVVQGNYVVGGVVFLILIVIQFIVIAKGAERVAEVSARFTLDAIPGKQMSIDADLRAGSIDNVQAANRRRALEKESQFYGAMDGAMKFVKGDAIAGIIITLINIIGGIVIGRMQMGMDLAEAAGVFTLLTIGDGLVSQIPALLLTTAAGLVVTRVAQADAPVEQGVARDIFEQITARPKPLIYVAVLLVLIGFLPGFPAWVFWPLAVLVGLLAIPAWQSAANTDTPAARGAAEAAPSSAASGLAPPHPTPVQLLVDPSLAAVLIPNDPRERREVEAAVAQLRTYLAHEMGLLYPTPQISMRIGLGEGRYAIRIFEFGVAEGEIQPSQAVLMTQSPTNAPRNPVTLPWNGAVVEGVSLTAALLARRANQPVLLPREFVLCHLSDALRRHSADLLGLQETRTLLNHLEENFPTLVQEVLPARLNLQQICEVLQRLLREQVSIRDLRQIMESLARWSQKVKEPAELVELVRRDLARVLCGRLSAGGEMYVYTLSDGIERELHESFKPAGQALQFRPSAELCDRIAAAATENIRPERHAAIPAVVLTRATLRRHVRTLLEPSLPTVSVVCYEELATGIRLRRLARLGEAA